MKKVLSLLLILLLAASLCSPVFAEDNIPITIAGPALIVDDGNLLSDEEQAALLALAESISSRQKCDVAVVTVDDLGFQSAQDFADDYFDYNGYGYGSDRSGMMLVISMEERDWYVTTRGEAIDVFSENRIDLIMNKIISSLSAGFYYDAFKGFLNTADSMLNVYRGTATEEEIAEYSEAFVEPDDPGEDYDPYYDPSYYDHYRNREPNYIGSAAIALFIGFLLAFIPMGILRRQVQNVHRNETASNYNRQDSFHLDVSRDIYLYSNTSSRVIETNRTPSGGGGGGVSHTHVSSSGATHGGHGGKF